MVLELKASIKYIYKRSERMKLTDEGLKLLKKGHNLRRASWDKRFSIYLDGKVFYFVEPFNGVSPYTLRLDDIEAKDWQVVNL